MAEKIKTKFGLISLGSKSSKMILDEAAKLFDEANHIDIRKIEIKMDKTTEVLYDGAPLEQYDCLFMRGSFRYANLLFALSEIYKDKCFVPIDANAHVIAHNKFMTQLVLSSKKFLHMPSTYYTAKLTETKQFLKTLNYPIILKFPTGTHGKGVVFSESYSSAASMIDALDVFDQPVLIQEYINIKSDIRVIVAGDKIAGAMKRTASADEVRANAHQGGDAEPFVVTTEIKNMSLEAAKMLNAKICAVDIIESDYGPLILEVNTSPGLQKITEVTKKNIAADIAKYLYEETVKIKTSKDKKVARDIMGKIGVEEIGERELRGEVKIRNNKIILPEFVYDLAKLNDEEEVTFKVKDGKIEIIKD